MGQGKRPTCYTLQRLTCTSGAREIEDAIIPIAGGGKDPVRSFALATEFFGLSLVARFEYLFTSKADVGGGGNRVLIWNAFLCSIVSTNHFAPFLRGVVFVGESWAAKHKADRIVAEANQGGAMVESTIRVVDPRNQAFKIKRF